MPRMTILAITLLVSLPAATTQASGEQNVLNSPETNWTLRIQKDEFTGRVEASAKVINANGDVLGMMCNGRDGSFLSIQFLPKRFLGSQNNAVLVKFDLAEPLSGTDWEYTSQGAYTLSNSFLVAFTASASSAEQRILVRAFNYEDQPVDAEFLSFNAKEALRRVISACDPTPAS